MYEGGSIPFEGGNSEALLIREAKLLPPASRNSSSFRRFGLSWSERVVDD